MNMDPRLSVGGELWAICPDLPEYEASNLGRVRFRRTGNIRKLKTSKTGYKLLSVSNGRGSSENKPVSRLVCRAFNGPPPAENMDCDHINRVRDDNRPENLRWLTRAENLKEREVKRGTCHHASKLTPELVRQIRASKHYRGFDGDFARRHGVSREAVRDARNGKLWRHVE